MLASKARQSLREAQAHSRCANFDDAGFEGEELVMLAAPLLPIRLPRAISRWACAVLSQVNGVAVKNLKHLVELLRDSRDEFLDSASPGAARDADLSPQRIDRRDRRHPVSTTTASASNAPTT